jgi:putative ABC transport system permease protein
MGLESVLLMEWLRDARHAFRLLAKAPGYTLAAVITLTFAVAANSAIFGVVYAVLLRPLPVRQPENLVLAWETDPARAAAVGEISYGDFERWSAGNDNFGQAAAMGSSLWPALLRGSGEPARVATAGVSSQFFETLGVSPVLGRALVANDDVPNAPGVAVVSYHTWVGRFGAARSVVGRTVELDRARMIVGVMPKDFDFPRGCDFWIPVRPVLAGAMPAGSNPFEDIGVLLFIGRLRSGATHETAAAELNARVSRSSNSGGLTHLGRIIVTPFLDYFYGPVRQGMWALWAAVGVLLVIACTNVSGLMLTRVATRSHEYAVRLALGAPRSHLHRIWALEALVVAVISGGLGLLSAGALIRGIVALAPGDAPRLADASTSPAVGAFTCVAVLVAALVCGVAPARQAGHTTMADALKESSRVTPGRRTQRIRSALVVIQIALAVVLLVAAGLVVRSFVALRVLDVGFVPTDVVTMFVQAPSNSWMQELLTRLKALPDVSAVGAIYLRPLELGPIGDDVSVVLDGQVDTPRTRQSNPALNHQIATPDYFQTLRIRLIRGRFFSERDGPKAPRVAIVSDATAKRLWPGQNPIGKRVLLPTEAGDGPPMAWRTVVGVVDNVRYRGLGDLRLDVYDAALQSRHVASYVVLRTPASPIRAASAVKEAVHQSDPRIVVDSIATLDAVVSRAIAPWRFSAWMLALFAAFGFVLVAVGLFSIVTIDVANRHHELAVRRALGAQQGDLLRSVLAPASLRALAGVSGGVLAGALAARGLRSFLFEVAPFDPITWSVVVLLVVVMVGLASCLPARRVGRIDAAVLLRRD